jgi:hypothetical protein
LKENNNNDIEVARKEYEMRLPTGLTGDESYVEWKWKSEGESFG